ncbi:Uncharacterized membrane protein [Halogranum gelatinilyticum]|uniref:Uncharacterized membrane protein n=1 Tax=Halogranum gelatinilyticum TaxID=660521 RepID=A0A1G9PYC3_9EURY|nr:DUF502 domain-containing protein [Halogranum gelatinilyticum]SDM03768.1 Uncharacterized membrane protein [Halogranum gelatinilyticum]
MSLFTRVRTSFIAGLLLVTPLAVTVFVLQFVFTRLTGILNPVVQATELTAYTANIEIVAQLLAAVLIALVITTLGFIASWSLGQRLFGGLERAVGLVPVVRTVYFGVRQVSESLTKRDDRFESVVLVEYPRKGVYRIGFVTSDGPRSVDAAAGTETVAVFLPHSPNPTAGALVLVSPDQLYEVDMSVSRGLRLIVTTGLTVEEEELPVGVVQ